MTAETSRNSPTDFSSNDHSQFRAVFDSALDAMLITDSEGRYLDANPAACDLFGLAREELLGCTVFDFAEPESKDEIRKVWNSFIKTGELKGMFKLHRRDGQVLELEYSAKADFVPGRHLSILRNITESRRAEEALKESETRLREQTEVLETVHRTGQLLSAELDLHKLLQALTDAATELVGARFGSFFYNVLSDEGASYMLYTLSGVSVEHFKHLPMPRATDMFGPTFRGEGVIRIADVRKDSRYGNNSPYYGIPPGHLPVVSYLAVPVTSRSGEVLGGLFFGHPQAGVFTRRHERTIVGLASQAAIAIDNARLFQKVRQAREEAESANRAKDEFLATVSHELRTPLNAIMGWARMIRMGKLDNETMARAVETIERNAKSQAAIIEDILDVSRIITGKLRLSVRTVELAPIIGAAIDSVRPAAEAKAINFTRDFTPERVHVTGDPDRLQQVIWNLLSNAVKFTPAGGRVEIKLESRDSTARITVSDTGQGISREFLPYVFDRFRQADSTSTRLHGGLGLGLALVRHITEMHGGAVRAASDGAGCGATFTVTLPISQLKIFETEPSKKEERA